MDFGLPDEVRMLKDGARRFVGQELMPHESAYANDPDIPDELRVRLQAKAKALGFWAFDLPEAYGGGGVGALGMCVVMEELAKCNIPAFRAPTVFTPYLGPVLFHGTDAQKEKYLQPVIRGDKRTCFALTEPNAGSDPSQMTTTAIATATGDRYRINGRKVFITGADKADFVQLFARIGDDPKKGITCFVLDRDTPGMRLGQSFELMSPDRPWEIVLDNVRVPASHLVGEEGKGFALGQKWLGHGRVKQGARALGATRRRVFNATIVLRSRSTARYTTPWPPAPRRSWTTNRSVPPKLSACCWKRPATR